MGIFGDSWSTQNNESPLIRGVVGIDPLSMLFPGLGDFQVDAGDKLNKWVSENIAKKDPIIALEREYGPSSWSKEIRKVSDWALEKPIDSALLATGLALGGTALAGGFGGGGAGAGASGGLGGGSAINPMWGAQGTTIPGIAGNVSTGTGIYASGVGGGFGATGASGGLGGALGGGAAGAGAMGASDWAQLGMGLLNSQQQPQQQQQAIMQHNPNSGQPQNPVLMEQMRRNQRAQELRRKSRRTQEEELELRELTRSKLLG